MLDHLLASYGYAALFASVALESCGVPLPGEALLVVAAVFRSVFARSERIGAGPVLRLWHKALVMASRFWQIESLYRANAKYRPTWQPRYLCFPTARELPRIALAALQAEAFLVAPHPVRRLRPDRAAAALTQNSLRPVPRLEP